MIVKLIKFNPIIPKEFSVRAMQQSLTEVKCFKSPEGWTGDKFLLYLLNSGKLNEFENQTNFMVNET
jgi:hypothetical protein